MNYKSISCSNYKVKYTSIYNYANILEKVYYSPSQVTINKTKDFDDFIKKIGKKKFKNFHSNKIQKFKKYDISTKKSVSNVNMEFSYHDLQISENIFKDSLLDKGSPNNFNLNSPTPRYKLLQTKEKYNRKLFDSNNNFFSIYNKISNDSITIMDKENTSCFNNADFSESNLYSRLKHNSIISAKARREEADISNYKKSSNPQSEKSENFAFAELKLKPCCFSQSRNCKEIKNILSEKSESRKGNNSAINSDKNIFEDFPFKGFEFNSSPDSINSLSTIDRGFAFLNSCNINLPSLKPSSTIINLNSQKHMNLMHANKSVSRDTNNIFINRNSWVNLENISISQDFLKSLKLNKNLFNFLNDKQANNYMIMGIENFTILAQCKQSSSITNPSELVENESSHKLTLQKTSEHQNPYKQIKIKAEYDPIITNLPKKAPFRNKASSSKVFFSKNLFLLETVCFVLLTFAFLLIQLNFSKNQKSKQTNMMTYIQLYDPHEKPKRRQKLSPKYFTDVMEFIRNSDASRN